MTSIYIVTAANELFELNTAETQEPMCSSIFPEVRLVHSSEDLIKMLIIHC